MMYSTNYLPETAGLPRNEGNILVHLSKAVVVLIILLVAITGALAYGISAGCDSCGPVMASLWGVALLVVLPIMWGWSRTAREIRECIRRQCYCDHEFIQEEHQEVIAWHGDCPIWLTVNASRCWKCSAVQEVNVAQEPYDNAESNYIRSRIVSQVNNNTNI
jgi:hypothetical protein